MLAYCLLAGVNVDSFDASLALDVTAPVEFALATLFDRRLERDVTSSATRKDPMVLLRRQ